MTIATREPVMWLRKIVDIAVPASVALAAFLHAHAIGALIDATVPSSTIAPFAEARAASGPASASASPHRTSADAILDRNAFDHQTGSLRAVDAGNWTDRDALVGVDEEPSDDSPPCEGVRAAITVKAADDDASLAALVVGGKSLIRRRGTDVENLRVVSIGQDRVWLLRNGRVCQARVFDAGVSANAASAAAAPAPPAGALEKEIAGKIVKSGTNEYQVDRGALDRILDAQAELMKTPLVPEKEGDRIAGYRVVRVKPGSALAMLGLESGDRLDSINGAEVTSMERMMEVYARFRTGTVDRMTLHIVRGGKPTNLDYVVR